MLTIVWGYLKVSVNVLIAQFEALVNIDSWHKLTTIKNFVLVTASATGLLLNYFLFQNNRFSEKEDSKQSKLIESYQNLTLSYNEKEVIKKSTVSNIGFHLVFQPNLIITTLTQQLSNFGVATLLRVTKVFHLPITLDLL